MVAGRMVTVRGWLCGGRELEFLLRADWWSGRKKLPSWLFGALVPASPCCRCLSRWCWVSEPSEPYALGK